MKEFLQQLLKSLNEIEIKGKENLDIMLGCMMAIEKAIKQIDSEQDTEVSDNG